jgi:hypothetical protein
VIDTVLQSRHSVQGGRLTINFLHGFRAQVIPTGNGHKLGQQTDSGPAVPNSSPLQEVFELVEELLQSDK